MQPYKYSASKRLEVFLSFSGLQPVFECFGMDMLPGQVCFGRFVLSGIMFVGSSLQVIGHTDVDTVKFCTV